jgi:hypothetical protein
VYNRNAKIISAGLASVPVAFAAEIGAEYVDIVETINILRGYGLDLLADGYGLHSYPDVSETPELRSQGFEALMRPCSATTRHPCWLTEWGIRQPKLGCPSDEAERIALMREMLARIEMFARQRRVVAAYYYDWSDDPVGYAIWRCGSLTVSGRLLFNR